MAERADRRREVLERIALAAVGAVALTAERADALADELAERGGLGREDTRALIESMALRWRGETSRVTERAGESLQTIFMQLGLVTREEFEELELRVAQLEHRLRLLEDTPSPPPPPQH